MSNPIDEEEELKYIVDTHCECCIFKELPLEPLTLTRSYAYAVPSSSPVSIPPPNSPSRKRSLFQSNLSIENKITKKNKFQN